MSGWWIYLAIGVGFLMLMLLLAQWRGGTHRTSDLMRALQAPKTRREWFADKLLAPGLACIATVFAWPVVLVWAAKEVWTDKREERRRLKREQDGVFRIRPENLQRTTTVEEVEETERVHDPLGAVPSEPFGHLHPAWLDFLQQRPEGAQLWTFACDWTTEWGTVFARRGYVWVADQVCAPWVLTSHQSKEEADD